MRTLLVTVLLGSSLQVCAVADVPAERQVVPFLQDVHGFVDARYGLRTQSDARFDDETLSEIRLQLNRTWDLDRFTGTVRSDFLYDGVVSDHDRVDLETGKGPVDLREANALFTPADFMDVKAGRQILTWGTGDMLFVNDLFPKDWTAFFAGRDEEYLKAPSDALFMSFFPAFAGIDIAYTPRFDADRFLDGERFSYWDGSGLTGATVAVDKPDRWFSDDEVAVRAYRPVLGVEVAVYGYNGFWKSPQGFDPASGRNTFPDLSVYGASARRPLAGGIARLEGGYYDSREDRGGSDPWVPNSQFRLLAGYEHELIRNLTGSWQYYLEQMRHHRDYRAAYSGAEGAEADENRHVVTQRLTQMLLNQTLILSLFTYWSPSDQDGYLRPKASYKLTDRWLLETSAGIFFGQRDDTFFGQFEDNSNVALAARYSF